MRRPGAIASISMPVYSALKLWADQKNADGGVYVKAFDKKIPVKLVAYDDQSNTATASTLYNQLITQDKVDLLVADSGSVLTAPAVAIARDHKMFLFDQTGTGASFFSKDNPYIALMADPVSTIWPKPVADFVITGRPGARNQEGRNSLFDQRIHRNAGQRLPQIRQGVRRADRDRLRSGRSDRDHQLHRHHQQHQQHPARCGDPFRLRAERHRVPAQRRRMSASSSRCCSAIYAGLETELLEKNVGDKGLEHVFTYVPPSELDYPVNFGMNMKDYKAAWDKKYPDGKIEFGFNAVAGYTTGPCHREDAVGRDQPRSARTAPRRVQPVRANSRRSTARLRSTRPAARSAS